MGSSEFRTICELFLGAVENHPKPDAFLVKSQGRYGGVSSEEVLRQVAALEVVLERHGVARGDRVAILSENRLEWALTDFALLGLGAIDVPIYPTLLEPDVGYVLRDSGSIGVVLSTRAQLKKILNLRPGLPGLRFVLVMDGLDQSLEGVQGWHEVVGEELGRGGDAIGNFRRKAAEVRPDQTVVSQFEKSLALIVQGSAG